MNDFRLAVRVLKRTPFSATLAAVTLALGVAVTVAIFTVVRGVLLRDLPYPEPDRLVLVWRGTSQDPGQRGALSPPDLLDLRERAGTLEEITGVNSFATSFLPDEGDPEQVQLGVVSGDFFSLLGVRPHLGRVIGPTDDVPLNTRDSTAVGVIVLAHDFWQRRFGGDRGVVGRTLRMGGSRMMVVGVLPEGFGLHMPAGSGMSTELVGWTPLGIDYATAPRDGAYLKVLARLAPGRTLGQARAEAEAVAAGFREEHVEHLETGTRLRVEPLQAEVVAHVRPVLLVLALSGLLVLLVACADVAALLLFRFLGRSQEVAVRGALGAERHRIVRQLLVESGVVTAIGTAAGVLLAVPAVRLLLRLEPGIVPRTGPLGLDAGVVLPALALAALTALLCGLAPSLLIARGELSALLRAQRSGPSPGSKRLRRVLIGAQVAAAFALLYGGASLLGTLSRLERTDLGFVADDVLTFGITLPFGQYRGPDAWVPFFGELGERLSGAPGLVAVGATSDLPMAGNLSLEPYAPAEATGESWGARNALHHVVTPGYFGAARIGLREGRDFTAADREGAGYVAIVDDALARRLLAERPGPIPGRLLDVTVHEFRSGYSVTRRTVEVVGVVSTVAHAHPDAEPPGTIYMPHAQFPLWSMSLVLRARPGSLPSIGDARRIVAGMNPALPVHAVRPLEVVVDNVLAPTRFLLALVAVFSIAVIGLTAAGLFGMVAEGVRQRRRELGIRLALGATPRRLAGGVLLGGLVLTVAGMVPGVLLTPLAGRLLDSAVGGGADGRSAGGPGAPGGGGAGDRALGDVDAVGDGGAFGDGGALGALDVIAEVSPAALAAAAAILVAVATLACCIPALRAATVDPMRSLREE